MSAVSDRLGIYFGLPEADYHADPHLGSTNMKSLAVSPPDYWFNSQHNSLRDSIDDREKQSLYLGRAYHKLVLEGRKSFEAAYGKTVHRGNTKDGMKEIEEIERSGRLPIKENDWNRILLADGVIENDPHLSKAFKGGPTEVSIFWDDEGVPKKARIDCLKVGVNSDFKTIAPYEGRDFSEQCIDHMARYQYPVQAAHYAQARSWIWEFVNDGLVFGDHDSDHLRRVATNTEWMSFFTFLKKTGAPLVWGTYISRKNPIIQIAEAQCLRATETYRRYVDKYGLDTPWLDPRKPDELAIEAMPGWWRTYKA